MKFSSAIVLAGAAQTFAALRPRPMVSSVAIQDEIKTDKYVSPQRSKEATDEETG